MKIAGNEYNLGQFDAIYIARDSAIEVSTKTTVDFAEFSAGVKGKYSLKVVRYADVAKDPGMKFVTGNPGSRRELNVLIANNVEAGRLIAGFTSSDPGNWTSWPPHEHAKMLEEMYVYFDMPEPAYGLQLVYNDTHYPELVTAVRDGDAVLMPNGYHPNDTCRDIGSLFSGPWPRPEKSKTGNSVWLTSNRNFNKSVQAWMRHGNNRPGKTQEEVKVNGGSELDRRRGIRRTW